MSKLIKDLGAVSAYAYAVEKGYTGTEDEFAELMYDYTDVAQTAVEAKDEAVSASASAQASATTANTKADEASASASKAQSASDSAQGAETNAETFALNAGTKATEAKQFADKAELNAQKTQSDKEAVESAKSDALSAVDNAQNYADSAQSASQAIQNMNVQATTLEPDSDATVEKTVDAISGAVTLTYGIPKGQVGEKGDKGDTGDSGVYIGASAPSDENVNVWIDSDGEPDDVIQIDDTLTQSGQAADAKVVGDEIGDIKEELNALEVKGKTKKTLTSSFCNLSEADISNVEFSTDKKAHVYGINRFNIVDAVITHDGYSSTVITKTDTGISVYYPGGGTNKSAFASYMAEFDGDLWLSCEASTKGNVRDLRFNVMLNGTLCAQCYGTGLLKQKITVSKGDEVQMRFLIRDGSNIPNTVNYEKIMISYTDAEFAPFNDYDNEQIEIISHTLPYGMADWTKSTSASGTTGCNVRMISDGTYYSYEGIPKPSKNSQTPVGVTVTGLPLITYNQAYNGTEGLGISTNGNIILYVKACTTKEQYLAWLESNPVTVSYSGENTVVIPFDGTDREFISGEMIEFAENTAVSYYYKPQESVTKKKIASLENS